MGIVQDFIDDLKSYLVVDAQLAGSYGTQLNEGDEFRLKIRVTNTAPQCIKFSLRDLKVQKTNNAVPLDSNGNEVDVVTPPVASGLPPLPFTLDPAVIEQFEFSEVRMRAKKANLMMQTPSGGTYSFTETVAKIDLFFDWRADMFTPLFLEKSVKHDILPG